MATYREIQQRVKAQENFVPKNCWIAHVKSDHGLVGRNAPNRYDPNARTNPCPDGKRPAIEDALRHFGMI